MESSNDKCVYCGKDFPETMDHIPPKSLFPSPRPDNLITVPCCEQCNKGFEENDEYFRNVIVANERVSQQPEAKKLVKKLIRSFDRPEGFKKVKEWRSRLSFPEIQTKGGIFTGIKPIYEIESDRMRSVIDRITKGLHFKEEKEILRKDYEITSFFDQECFRIPAICRLILFEEVIEPMKKIEPIEIGKNIFSYRRKSLEDQDCWLYVFFNEVGFLSFVKNIEHKA